MRTVIRSLADEKHQANGTVAPPEGTLVTTQRQACLVASRYHTGAADAARLGTRPNGKSAMSTAPAQLQDHDQPELIACLLSEREQAIRGEEIAATLFTHVAAIAELPDGYAFRFDDPDTRLPDIMAFVAAERRCCPFLSFEVAFTPHAGPLWLRLRGSDAIKTFVADMFVSRVPGDG